MNTGNTLHPLTTPNGIAYNFIAPRVVRHDAAAVMGAYRMFQGPILVGYVHAASADAAASIARHVLYDDAATVSAA